MNPLNELVEKFDNNRDAYLSGKYNETQVRREFIDPLFKLLGWDVENHQGYAEAYKDVFHEDSIKVGGATKAPDYSFRIGGTRKFFLEAKRPSVNIREDISPAYQLRRYAWSAKLPLSILTDFEEFAVYDCRVKPVLGDKASTARVLYLNYTEYADKWDDIAAIFSRDAILKGSFDRYAESHKGKRGTAEVDTAFLREMETWRETLAKNLALRNPQLEKRDLNFAVQKILDRFIFLRMCEDRGIEFYGQLQALQNGTQIYPRLCQLFRQADDRYNSGLFHFKEEKDRPTPPDHLTLDLSLDDKVLRDIIKSLYYPESPYEFSVLPTEILGQVYEQFLGKVIRLTGGHRAIVEEKPEVRKAGGVYYTPIYIVDYIVRQTVGKLLEGQKPGPRSVVNKITILDPACGSGSFLIGAYNFLLTWYRDRYVEMGPGKHQKALYQGPGGVWQLTTAEKKRILLTHIYGVDIDPQAVETTKLSLLLKVLEGESGETLKRQFTLFHERALPDLGGNIKCGNSLIGPDFYDQQQTDLFDEEERYRVNVFDWHAEFPKIMQSGGFDAVIGNPPYGAMLSKPQQNYLTQNFPNSPSVFDTYMLFMEQGLSFCKTNGHFGMITPNTWEQNFSANKFRKFLVENFSLLEIVHFQKKVFPKVTVDCEIIIIKNNKPIKNDVRITIRNAGNPKTYSIEQIKWISKDGDIFSIFQDEIGEAISQKISKGSIPLETICEIKNGVKPFEVGKGNPPQTKETLKSKPFVSNTKDNETFKPLLRGSLINRYRNNWEKNYWISYGPWLAAPRNSDIFFKVKSKIIIRQTGDSIVSTIIDNSSVCRDNLHIVFLKENQTIHLLCLLGLINSRLMNYFYGLLNPESGETFAQVKLAHVKRLPIRDFNPSNPQDQARHDRMVRLVERMLELNKNLAAAKTAHDQNVLKRQIDAADRQIDNLVYELYGLTDEEIAIVEESVKK